MHQNGTIMDGLKAQWIGTVCGTIEYQISGPEMASLKMVQVVFQQSLR